MDKLLSAENRELKLPYSKMALSMEYVGISVDEPDYWYWCVSPIWGEDNRVHLFCSRWPVGNGMNDWRTRGEIVHWSGSTPEGPFEFEGVVLSNRDLGGEGRYLSPHNPHIKRIDGKYILTYIVQDLSYGELKGMSSCIMCSDSLYGPWKQYGKDGVVVRPSRDEGHWTFNSFTGTDNPALEKIDGSYYLFFKAGKSQDGQMHYGYAKSDSLMGEYIVSECPKMNNTGYIEDAMVFKYNGRVYMLTTDNMGVNTGIFGAGILWTFREGYFDISDASIGFGVLSDYTKLPEQTTYYANERSTKLERPAVLMTDGKLSHFYGCTRANVNGTGKSGCYVLRIKDF